MMPEQNRSPEPSHDGPYPSDGAQTILLCIHCQRSFLSMAGLKDRRCPLCQIGQLETHLDESQRVDPEGILPFEVSSIQLQSIYADFVKGVWIKPTDFTPEALSTRSVRLFWPNWLVDCDVNGAWKMEAGFDYQVESAKESFVDGQWQSVKRVKDRIRWEPRLGELNTHVENIAVPALREHQNRIKMTGPYAHDRAVLYQPPIADDALFEVPDLPPDEAWTEARPMVDKTIEATCQMAAGAQHSQHFELDAQYERQNWTQLYQPIIATHYRDDHDQPQILIVNGQTGQINGPRLASSKRGLKIAGWVAIGAGAFFLLALLVYLISLLVPDARVIAGLFGVLGLITGAIAIIPTVWPYFWNQNQTGPHIAERKRE